MAFNFDDYYKNVCKNLSDQGLVKRISAEFSKLSFDRQRVEYIRNLGLEQKFSLPCLDVEAPKKDSTRAIRLRNEGNDAFVNGKEAQALKLYTRSALNSPSHAELALAYANRSAVLFTLKFFKDCEADINRAISMNYPEYMMFKLMKRKGECLCKLKRYSEAKKCFQDCIEYLKVSSLEDEKRKDVEKNVSKLLTDCGNCHEHVEACEVSPEKCLPALSGGKNEEIGCASNVVRIHYSEDFGRQILAARNIMPGDVLAVEDPFASVLLHGNFLSHCYHCMKRSWSLIPCDHCCNVSYCSEECRKYSWQKYHEKECSSLFHVLLLELGPMAHLSLRIVLSLEISSLDIIIKEIERNPNSSLPRQKGFSENGVYNSLSYTPIYQLEGHSKSRRVPDLFRRSFMTYCIVECLKFNTNIFKSDLHNNSENLELLTGTLILRHLQNLPCNAHEVTELLFKELKPNTDAISRDNYTSFLLEVGAAAYALHSLINHSCDPNVVRHSVGTKVVLRAIRTIREGEQILDNYGYHYATDPLDIRKRNLKGQYFFDCNCVACLEKWPCYEELNEVDFEDKLRCPNCKVGPMKPVEKEGSLNSVTEIGKLFYCNKCQESTDMTYLKEKLIKASEDFKSILSEVFKGKRVDKKKLTDHLILLDEALVRPWKEFNDCQEALKHIYALEGNSSQLSFAMREFVYP